MNFFQPPSSLGFPRAMVAGQQLPRGCGETAACALGPSAAAALGAGRDPGGRLHPPLPLRRSECQTRRGGAGARAGGGGGGAGAGGGRGGSEPRTYRRARGRSRARCSATRSSRPGSAEAPAATGDANGAPATGDLCGSDRGRRKSEGGKDGQTDSGRTQRRRKRSAWRRARAPPLLYTAPRAAGPAHQRPGWPIAGSEGRGPGRGAGVGPAQRSRGGERGGRARGGAERGRGTSGRGGHRAAPSSCGPAPASPAGLRGLAPASPAPRRPPGTRPGWTDLVASAPALPARSRFPLPQVPPPRPGRVGKVTPGRPGVGDSAQLRPASSLLHLPPLGAPRRCGWSSSPALPWLPGCAACGRPEPPRAGH